MWLKVDKSGDFMWLNDVIWLSGDCMWLNDVMWLKVGKSGEKLEKVAETGENW